MVCLQPPVPVTSDVDVTVKFVVDNAPSSALFPFTVRPNPQFHQRSIDFNPETDKFIVINGSNLDVADKSLYRVSLSDDVACIVSVLDKTVSMISVSIQKLCCVYALSLCMDIVSGV